MQGGSSELREARLRFVCQSFARAAWWSPGGAAFDVSASLANQQSRWCSSPCAPAAASVAAANPSVGTSTPLGWKVAWLTRVAPSSVVIGNHATTP
jgi:hypothetical protein